MKTSDGTRTREAYTNKALGRVGMGLDFNTFDFEENDDKHAETTTKDSHNKENESIWNVLMEQLDKDNMNHKDGKKGVVWLQGHVRQY
eukprot:scaffold73691_cov47-Attheya_sp.AAC.2